MIQFDDDIFDDFLIESQEIIDALNGQLIDLEKTPEDAELLNALFRSFHTLKGGAGFLGVDAVVVLCHACEDVFDKLRHGQIHVTAAMMDLFLLAYDELQSLFAQLQNRQTPTLKQSDLVQRLRTFLSSENTIERAEEPAQPKKEAAPEDASIISDDEFENLLDSLHGQGQAPQGCAKQSQEDMISDDEFERILDTLHGEGQAPGQKQIEQKRPITEAPAVKPVSTVDPTVRVDIHKLDSMMNLVGELVLVRNRLLTLDSQRQKDKILSQTLDHLDLLTTDLQNAVMMTRMQPIKKIFSRFPRIVRDLSQKLGKKAELVLEGEETQLDKNLVEALADPLIHLVRNALDHGLETPQQREELGKSPQGTLKFSAVQEGDHILLIIEDDGAGIDIERIKQKAMSKGLVDAGALEAASDRDILNLIFMPGFSTCDAVSDISGRGVGMDVVKSSIGKLNGSIELSSTLGVGTRLVIHVPLTLAILPTLMVRLHRHIYAIPLSVVDEILLWDPSTLYHVDDRSVIMVREKALPLYFLSDWLSAQDQDTEQPKTDHHVVLMRVGERQIGFVVHDLLGQQDVVIKPLGKTLQNVPGIAGATITGEGHISLILDMLGLVRHYA